ncbi:hypothetical protein [Lentzea flaviverrucosa]|uniref:Uncharacterized protein n=1 Tax=Lentzea flaviverrucosa TaxID=200379 RepID=A0A1H9CAB3_9PSEU|nr:hypothetical protein [Lentzea flaviverrucosa]RDI24491.1 hypothetical protein DFR72_10971 [Lentzea flaviverrucosa]SEP98079.1 hypothetical protein SAMN05216195_101726 [Lentzea flaviverrucosa]
MTDDRPPAGDLTDQHVPGRVAVGTITRIGAVRQEPPVRRSTAPALWGSMALAVAEAALSPVVGGVSMLAKAALVIGVVTAATFALHRWAPRPGATEVHPFWVKDVTGAEHPCQVRGFTRRGLPAEGTGVQVYGRTDRSGTVLVRELITDDGQVCRPRLPLRQKIVRGVELLNVALWAAAALTVAWLLVFSR